MNHNESRATHRSSSRDGASTPPPVRCGTARGSHTRLVRFDPLPEDPFGATSTPIYQTATFEQESASEFGRFDYSRSGNPTREVLERHLASLEGANRAMAFASGLAAITAVTRLLAPGDEILACDDLYGGTYRLFSKILSKRGVKVRYADLTDASRVAPLIGENTRLVYLETPTNPLQRICDLRNVARASREHGALLCVDSTAMTPYLQRPLELGADVVIHSATKGLCGHADVSAGVVAVRDESLAAELAYIQNGEGATLGPFDSFLLMRGIKTLGVRLDRQQATARRVAEFLRGHAEITRVHFAGLEDHPGAALHASQAEGPGCVVSLQTGSYERSCRLVESLELFSITVSFGSVNSTASVPGRMSHKSIPDEVRASREFPEDLVRLSIGLENQEDLIADLDRAIGLTREHQAPITVVEAGRTATSV